MKIFLIYPHLVTYQCHVPHLVITSLVGYLRKNTKHGVTEMDFNIEVINGLIRTARPRNIGLKIKSLLTRYRILTRQGNIEALVMEGLKSHLHSNVTYDADVSRILKWQVTNKDLSDTIEGRRKDPLLSLVGEGYLEHFRNGPCLVGLSMLYINQLLSAVAIARAIKSVNPQAHIVLYGNTIRPIKRKILQTPSLFSVIDSFVVGEEEESLAKLASVVESKGSLREVPNLIFFNGDEVEETAESVFDIRKAASPDFTILKRHNYLFPRFPRRLSLPLRTSVGCFWNRCAFCTLSLRKYQQRDVNQVLDDMALMVQKYQPSTIRIMDLAVSTKRLLQIAEGIMQRRMRVRWEAFARLDRNLTPSVCRLLSRSGCVALVVGLESGSQRVEDLMNKGQSLAEMPAILDNLHRAGIYTCLCVIVGFPSETEAELVETLNFLRDNSRNISSVALSVFGLNFDSDVYKNPGKYCIKIQEPEGVFFMRNFPYEVDSGVTNEKARRYADGFRLSKWDRLYEKVSRRIFKQLAAFR